MNYRLLVAALISLSVSACTSFNIDKSLSTANNEINNFTNGKLELRRTLEQREQAATKTNALLSLPVDQAMAVEIALLNSPSVQLMLAQHWESGSSTALGGSIPNPIFEFERVSADAELEIERMLAIGLLDLLRFPAISRQAKMQIEADQIKLAADVVNHITEVRQAWINAVSSKQMLVYAEQIFSSAEASATLAANMQAIGNFNAVSRGKQQAYYADAATNLTVARHQALADREALIRMLGLDADQTRNLQLPIRLPELPETPMNATAVTQTAMTGRLDVNMAMAKLKIATAGQGLNFLGELTDIEIVAISETVWKEGERESSNGYEIGIEVPIFKNLGRIRDRLNAKSLVASNALDDVTRSAVSHLRESYSAYRSSFDIARHYRDEVVPLQQMISEESVLNYNGMIIGVFELLADSRAQIETVQSSIQASSQFWSADAALRATLVGKPASSSVAMSAGGGDAGGEDH